MWGGRTGSEGGREGANDVKTEGYQTQRGLVKSEMDTLRERSKIQKEKMMNDVKNRDGYPGIFERCETFCV